MSISMDRIADVKQMDTLISSVLRRGTLTNCPLPGAELRRASEAGELAYERWDGGLCILRNCGGFYRVSYYVTNPAAEFSPAWDMDAVVEGAYSEAMDAFWRGAGFEFRFHRYRLSRAACEGASKELPEPERVGAAEALGLLEAAFDRRTGCLPDMETLEWGSSERLMLSRRGADGELEALLNVKRERRSYEIRQLAVSERARGKGLAQSLVEEFIARYGSSQLLVWVRDDAPAARHIYEKYGFRADGRETAVWLRKG